MTEDHTPSQPMFSPARLDAALSWLLLAVAAVAVVCWIGLAFAHIDDRFMVNHVVGAWLALAAHAQDGTLYPPLFDGERYGGTRFMAIPVLLLAGAGAVAGNLLVGGKALSGVLFLALMGVMLAIVRGRFRCPWPIAMFFSAALLLTPTGWEAAMSVRFDALPVIWQLIAIGLIGWRVERRTVIAAALCCALAVLCKFSAVWGFGAIGLWLLARDRRMLAWFAAAGLVTLLAGAGAMHVLSDGRVWQSFTQLSFAGVEGVTGGVVTGIARTVWYLGDPIHTMLLLPLAAAGVLLAAARRSLSIEHLAWCCGLVVTAGILSDDGAYPNHLIDIAALSAIVTAGLFAGNRPDDDGDDRPANRSVLLMILLFAASVGFVRQDNGPFQQAGRHLTGSIDREALTATPLADVVGDDETILAEDPFMPISLGRRPVIGDPWMLRHIAEQHPHWIEPLHDRIADHEFDWIVLMQRLDERPGWYERLHLGSALAETIDKHYEPADNGPGYWLYRPRESTADGVSGES